MTRSADDHEQRAEAILDQLDPARADRDFEMDEITARATAALAHAQLALSLRSRDAQASRTVKLDGSGFQDAMRRAKTDPPAGTS